MIVADLLLKCWNIVLLSSFQIFPSGDEIFPFFSMVFRDVGMQFVYLDSLYRSPIILVETLICCALQECYCIPVLYDLMSSLHFVIIINVITANNSISIAFALLHENRKLLFFLYLYSYENHFYPYKCSSVCAYMCVRAYVCACMCVCACLCVPSVSF